MELFQDYFKRGVKDVMDYFQFSAVALQSVGQQDRVVLLIIAKQFAWLLHASNVLFTGEILFHHYYNIKI